jgi:uncharacterized protein with von Willebrand factor type A (vWA) domain
MDINDYVDRAVSKLTRAFGWPVAALPMFVSHDKNGHRAWTEPNGIWVNAHHIKRDPRTLHIVLGHEVLHWVVDNQLLLHKYPQPLVNVVTDYKINEILYREFKWDVRTVKGGGGLLRKSWFDWSFDGIAEKLVGSKVDLPNACAAMGVPNTKLAELASHLRRRLGKYLVLADDIFLITREEESEFYRQLGPEGVYGYRSVPADSTVLLKNAWYGMWSRKPVVAPHADGPLWLEQQLLYPVDFDDFRKLKFLEREDSLIMGLNIVKRLDSDADWRHLQVHRAERRVNGLEGKLHKLNDPRTKLGKLRKPTRLKMRRELKAELVDARRHLVKMTKLPPLASLIKSDPVKAVTRAQAAAKVRSMTTAIVEEKRVVKLPNLYSGASVRRIRTLVRGFLNVAQSTIELREEMKSALGDLGDRKKWGDDEEDEKKKPQANAGDPNAEADDGDPKGSGQSKSKDKTSKGQSEDEGDGDDEGESQKGKQSGGPGKSTPGDKASEGMNSSHGSPSQGRGLTGSEEFSKRLETFDLIQFRMGALERILMFMREAETLLKTIKRRPRAGTEGVEQIPRYSNDLSRVQPAEVALLANKNTKMAFLLKLAEHSLAVYEPPEVKRTPMTLWVDCSGSMSGSLYEKAIGFTLAFARMLQHDKRAVSIGTFDHKVRKVYVCHEGQTGMSLDQVIKVLLDFGGGGTNVDEPITRGFDLRDKLGWKNVNILVITDDDVGHIPLAPLLERKRKGDKIVGITVKEPKGHMAVVADEVYHLKGKQVADLVKCATTLM